MEAGAATKIEAANTPLCPQLFCAQAVVTDGGGRVVVEVVGDGKVVAWAACVGATCAAD